MNLRLKSGVKFAPDGIPFTDPRTGRKFSGYELSIDGAVYEIIRHRQANPAKYDVTTEPQFFDFNMVKQEFLRTLSGQRPDLFQTPVVVAPAAQAKADGTCFNCGSSDIEEILCPTCSGKKVQSKKCRTCGARIL